MCISLLLSVSLQASDAASIDWLEYKENKKYRKFQEILLKLRREGNLFKKTMSDHEYERFEITDYDLQNEFNTNRPRRYLSKEQQIYGKRSKH